MTVTVLIVWRREVHRMGRSIINKSRPRNNPERVNTNAYVMITLLVLKPRLHIYISLVISLNANVFFMICHEPLGLQTGFFPYFRNR